MQELDVVTQQRRQVLLKVENYYHVYHILNSLRTPTRNLAELLSNILAASLMLLQSRQVDVFGLMRKRQRSLLRLQNSFANVRIADNRNSCFKEPLSLGKRLGKTDASG